MVAQTPTRGSLAVMTTTPDEPARPVEDLLASPEVAKVVQNEEFKRFLDHMPFALAVSKGTNGHQRIVYGNPRFEQLVGQSCAEVDGKDWSILDHFLHEDDGRPLGRAVAEGGDFLGTFRSEGPEGEEILVEAYAGIIESEDGSEDYRIAAFVAVSGRERSQREEFERQLRDKDLLLREIQHRVKNNLQLIVALIRLEARNARDGSKTVDFDRLAGRISSIQVLYKALEEPAPGDSIDLGQYLGQIASAALGSYGSEGIRLQLNVDCCPVSINVALPTGLLVNEVMTNAFKYAFAGREGGTVMVECLREDDSYRVVVADDGIGMPTGVVWPAAGKLSGLILQSLRENTKAEMKVASAPGEGTQVTILLPQPPAAKVH
jgi:PAS domain S-box-containing protein